MPGSRTRRTAAMGVLAGGAAAVALSGCTFLSFQQGFQVGASGAERIATSICASGSTNCANNGNSNVPATIFTSATGQVLLGYRLSTGAVAPATLTSAQGVLVFTQSPSFTSELERLGPAPAGQRWVGYISNTQQYSKTAQIQADTVTSDFELTQAADGGPFPTPLAIATVVGSRTVNGAFSASRPVVCGNSLTTLFNEDTSPVNNTFAFAICVDSSTPSNFTTNSQFPTRDLGVLKGTTASAKQGALASLPFRLRFSGTASPAADYTLSATTNLPGAVAAPNPAELLPASNSDTVVPVAVGVPPNAAPGTYTVTLTAKALGSETRSGTGQLSVIAAPGGATTGGAAVGARLRLILPHHLSAAIARRKGITLLIGSTKRVRVKVQLFKGSGQRALVTRLARLNVPGPTRVVLKSARFTKGRFRIIVTGIGISFRAAGTLAR